MPFVIALPFFTMGFMKIEFAILDFFNTYIKNDFLDILVPFITSLGNGGFIWIVITIILLVMKKTRKIGFYMALSLIFSLIVCNLTLKPIFARTRPFEINKDITLLIKKPTDFSFPSGHTASSFAAATAFLMGNIKKNGEKKYLANKKYVFLIFFVAIVIAISRLYLYVHFPSDVFIALVLGTFLGYLASKVCDKIYKIKINRKEN